MVEDIRISLDFVDHWKVESLARSCGEGAIRCLLRLWCFAASRHPDGNLTGMEDQQIEMAAKWSGEAGRFIAGLRDCQLMDESALHDWAEHQPWVIGAPARRERARFAAQTRHARRMPDACPTHTSRMPKGCSERAPFLSSPILNTPLPPKGDVDPFEVFWKAYPRKVGKQKARAAWKRINKPSETLQLILAALRWQVTSEQWTKEHGQFIPHPTTYLNQGRWEDEPARPVTQPTATMPSYYQPYRPGEGM